MSHGTPLSGLRVVELGTLPAAAYCARLLGDLGADVIRLANAGDPLDHAATEAGAWFGFLHYGKTIATGDVDALLAGADVCVDSRPAASISVRPGLIHVDVSWFGRSGPYADFAGSDAGCRALAGLVQLVGRADGPPIAPPDHQSAIIGGLAACMGVLAGLLGREADGGRALEVSVHEACIALSEYQAAEVFMNGSTDKRLGINNFQPNSPLGIYPSRDGWIGITILTPTQWRDFCHLLGLATLGDAPDLALGSQRLPRTAELEAVFMPKLALRTTAEWFALGLQHRLPLVPVPDMAAVLSTPEFRQRGAVVPVEFGERIAAAPGAPFGLTRTPTRRGGAVPSAAAAAPVGWRSDRAGAEPAAGKGGLPLRNLRIVDLTMGWAGPFVTRAMADLGADVVKIEACQYPDWWRGFDTRPGALATLQHERNGRFVVLNRNKRGITLDLTTPEGVAIVRKLVAGADAVVENYSAGVLPKLGLAYADLVKINPSLVMASMSAFGTTSPWRECRAYGSTLEQGSGLPRLVGWPDDPPTMGHLAFGDAIGGLNGSCALMAALWHRRMTGEGQHIDLSQVECMLPFTAVAMMLQSLNGIVPARTGNRHPEHAPHGVFPCAGPDGWVLISVADDRQWEGLCRAIGFDAGPDLREASGRRTAQATIEAAVSAWTRQHDPVVAMTILQAHGVATGAVVPPGRLHLDPHLNARGFWQWQDRAVVGRHPEASLPFRESVHPYPARSPAPTLGQHTAEVLREQGLDDAAIARLADANIIGTTPLPANRARSRPVAA